MLTTSKFSKKRETKLAKKLGGKRRPASGVLWHHKEDIDFLHPFFGKMLLQLKSTHKKRSLSFKLEDFAKLEEHALLEKRIPIFVFDFYRHPLRERFFILREIDWDKIK